MACEGPYGLRVLLLPGSEAGGWPSGGGEGEEGGSGGGVELLATEGTRGWPGPRGPSVTLHASRDAGETKMVPRAVWSFALLWPDCQIARLNVG